MFSSRSMLSPRAEIGFAHGRVRHDFVRSRVGDNPALIEHEQAAAHAHDLRQVVLGQNRGDAAGVDPGDEIHKLCRFVVVQSGERLVQQNEAGIDRESPREFEALEVTERQRRDRLSVLTRKPDLGKDLACACFLRSTGYSRERSKRVGGKAMTGGERYILQHGHGAERTHDLVGEGETVADAARRRPTRDVNSGQHDASAVGAEHAGDDSQQRRFAGAVGSDQARHFAGRDEKAHSGEGLHAAEVDGGRFDFEGPNQRHHTRPTAARPRPASPSGAKRMTRMRSPPKISSRYSLMNRNISGSSVRMIAAATTPSVEPVPPMTTIAISITDTRKPNESGTMNWVK